MTLTDAPAGDRSVPEIEPPLRPPLGLLGLAAASLLVAALLLLGSGQALDIVGYVLATFVTVLLVGAYRAIDSRRRSRPTYVIPPVAQALNPAVVAWVLLVLGVVIGGIHVWRFADVVARS